MAVRKDGSYHYHLFIFSLNLWKVSSPVSSVADPDPHHFAGSGSAPKPMDPDPDADPTLFHTKLRKDVLQMN